MDRGEQSLKKFWQFQLRHFGVFSRIWCSKLICIIGNAETVVATTITQFDTF